MDERATGQPIRFEHYRVSTDEQGRPLKLGEGAMGVTYLAEDTNLKVRVALKVIRPQLLGDAEVGQRFQREAQAAARLRHPNVAGVYHLGMVDNTFFYAMEFVEGETVKDRVQRNGPLPLKEALEVALQVCEALGAAEKHKMVHRDIKPANIMLEAIEDDLLRVKLIDFGLAKPLHAEAQNSMALQTQAGIFLGTPVFASPEQIQDVPPDSRADFYSLGLTLWYMLEGRTPFEGSLHKVLFDQVHTAPPLGRLLWVPAEIRDLLGKMLEKDPVNRPQTARELRQKIHDCLRALATSGTSYTEWQQRFQVEGKPRSQPWGMIYEGQDTLSGAVRLHLLRNDRFSDPKAIQGVLGDARRAIDIHHPNILRHLTVFPTSGAQGTGWMVVTEHPGTQTLLDHLRKVKQLPPAEAIAIIERLASAIDTCIANDLITADLDPAGIFLKQVPRTEIHALTQTATATTTASVLSASTSETFEVVPKLSPINYSYLTTLRPADETAIGMTQGPFRAEATTPQELVQRLALLAYQCLGGAVGGAWSRVPRFIPLASLTQKQNDTLRTALVDSTWMRATDFVEAFQQTKTTRRTDETSRVSTSTEATVMLTSWRMLADLAAEDASGFSTEQAKEFTGKIEKQEAAPIAAPEEPATSQEEVAELSRTESESIQETEESPAADAAENVSHDTASVLDSTLTTERTQTWGRTEEPSESPAAETTETIAESTIETPPVDLKQPSPDETETLILSTGVNELLVTAAPPEIKEGTDTIAQSSAESVADQPAAAESGEKTEPEESLTREDAGVEEVAAPAHLTTSSATAEAPAANTPPAEPAAAEVEVQGTSPQTETHAHASATSSPEMAQEQPPAPSTPEAPGKTEPFAGSSTTQSVTTSSSLRPLAPLPTSSPKPAASTATSAVPLPQQVRQSQAKSPSSSGTWGDKVKSLPRWVLPAAAALAALILIAGIVSLTGDDGDDPVIADDPIDVPPQPPTPPPPALPTISELLATAATATASGDMAKLDETLTKIRTQFPDQSWESEPAAGAFRESLYRAYREKKLGNGAAALRKYHDIFVAATFAREPDLALLKQISDDLSSASDSALAEPFEKALLNSLAGDASRRKERMDEALAYIKKRPDSVVAALARGILSKELEGSVDYLEQNPRDQSQNEALRIALEALMPRMKELSDAGVPEAWYILGDEALKSGSQLTAMRLFEKAAEEHHPPSMRRYGIALTNRIAGREPDMVAAAEWLRYAVAAGDLKANLFLADIYLPEKPSSTRPRKVKEAYDLLNTAAEGGIPEAHYLLGSMLLDYPADDSAHGFASSIKNPAREEKAIEHLKKAVTGKVSRAYQKLANALFSKRQITEAVAILEAGAKLSPPDAICMYNLAMLYNPFPPELPVPPDELAAANVRPDAELSRKYYDQSLSLLRAAAKAGEPDAIEFCEMRRISYK